jgi:formate hydrogenlyase subunit 4
LSDFILVAAILALGAVFLVLGGLDSASAFGGMGSAREMTISSLIEPTVIVTFAAFALATGQTSIDGMLTFQPVLILSFIALLLIALAENARYPVDNPATHLELTMVHEAMVLEYSGPYLALLEYASALKLTIFSLLAANILFPFPLLVAGALDPMLILMTIGGLIVKIVVVMFLLALLESSIAKMRFFRMQEYLSIAFFVALAGLVVVLINLV